MVNKIKYPSKNVLKCGIRRHAVEMYASAAKVHFVSL